MTVVQIRIRVLLFSTLLFGGCGAGLAQCTTGFNFTQVNCGNSAGCQQQIIMSLPNNPGQFGVPFTCKQVSCCGVGGYPQCVPFGGTCYIAKLDNPTIRKQLMQLAETHDLMIASCRGDYLPLSGALQEPLSPIRATRRLPGLGEGSR